MIAKPIPAVYKKGHLLPLEDLELKIIIAQFIKLMT